MENKKIIQIMMVTITILLTITILGFILNIARISISRENNIYQIANQSENLESENVSTEDLDNENSLKDDNNSEISSNTKDIKELRTASIHGNSIINAVSSRSQAERQKQEEDLYVNTNPNAGQEQDYEELIQYTKIEDVKISFDMDVSKTTGLSKEDFIYLVKNMKYDKTGILERNAGWIWECCQTYSVNEIFVLGICGIESAWCSAPQHQRTHNYSSLMSGGKLIPYASDEAGFEAMIKLLGQKYLSPKGSLYHGATITGVGKCYCDPTSWPKKVYTCMQQVFK